MWILAHINDVLSKRQNELYGQVLIGQKSNFWLTLESQEGLHRISSIEHEGEKKRLPRLEKTVHAKVYRLKRRKGSNTFLCQAQRAGALDENHF